MSYIRLFGLNYYMYLLENIVDKQMDKIAEWLTQILPCLDKHIWKFALLSYCQESPSLFEKDWEYLETLEQWVDKRPVVKFWPHWREW